MTERAPLVNRQRFQSISASLAFHYLLTITSITVILLGDTTSFPKSNNMSHVTHAKLSEGRRVAIPAEMCRQYGLKPGAEVVLEPAHSGIMLRPLEAVTHEVQDYFSAAAPPEVRLSEELSKDRRKEAERERRG